MTKRTTKLRDQLAKKEFNGSEGKKDNFKIFTTGSKKVH
jgi:hypothetical protein